MELEVYRKYKKKRFILNCIGVFFIAIMWIFILICLISVIGGVNE